MSDTAPILYHCPQTRSGTAFWLNEEIGAPCQIEIIDLKKGGQKSPTFLANNPMGKLPTLIDQGICISETAAICTYLADKHSDQGLAPALDDPRRGTYLRWMFFAPSCIEPTMLDLLEKKERENTASSGHGAPTDIFQTIDQALSNGPYLLGDTFSAADVVFGSTLNFAMMFGAFEKKPHYTEYVDRIMARPAVARCNEKNAVYLKDIGWT